MKKASPRAGGGDPCESQRVKDASVLLPAQAGVIPFPFYLFYLLRTSPRAGGGDPLLRVAVKKSIGFSPRRRG